METILEIIEPFGKFQKQACFIIGLSSALAAMTIYTTIFTAARPKLLCSYLNSTDHSYLNDSCKIWRNISESKENNEAVIYKCEYDCTYYGKTIITDWDLVCDREYLANLAQTCYMLGGFSVLFSGYFGDRFGRRKSILGFIILLFITMTISQILTSELFSFSITVKYVIYCVAQFLTGAFSFSMYTSSYVLLMEITIKSYHTLFSNFVLYFYCFGELISLCISYFLRDWQWINIVMIGYTLVIILIVYLKLPESPFWLVSSGHYDHAYKEIVDIANKNGKKFKKVEYDINSKDDFYNAFDCIDPSNFIYDAENNKRRYIKDVDEGEENNSIKTMLLMILTPKLTFLKTALLGYIWITVSLLYFGVSLGITSIPDINPYLIVLFSTFAEIIGYSYCFFNSKYGHRKSNMFYMIFSSLMCLIIGLITTHVKLTLAIHAVIIIALTVLGKSMVSGSFNTCFIYSSEFYPTHVRNFAVLFLSSLGCIGSLISPQINLLGDLLWAPLPFLIFSASAFLAAIFGFILSYVPHS